jgi:glyoxylase-like metal-dependent hydrolase (beta-lactamase superfamily II)/ferredoxin
MENIGSITEVVVARPAERHPGSAPGDWFVDRRCIGCGASWSVAPHLFTPAGDGRFVLARQPADAAEEHAVQVAAELCPTRSIGTGSRRRWPPHHPMELRPGVWRCGHNAWASAGGNSYLVQRPHGGVLVDAPRWSRRLATRLARLGGVADLLVTHADDVADAERYAAALGARVWVHEGDAGAAPFADRVLRGSEPVTLAPGCLVVPTPGHTRGHVVLLVDDTVLFSGDHLAWDPDTGDLGAEPAVCWYSWPEQLASLRRLLDHTFTHVLPGHGAASPELAPADMRERLSRLVDRLAA